MRFQPGKYYKTIEERNLFRVFLVSEYKIKKTTEISAELGLHRDTIVDHLNAMNIKLRKGPRIDRDKELIIVALRKQGKKLSDIEKEMKNVGWRQICKTLEEHGLYKRSEKRRKCKVGGCNNAFFSSGFCWKHHWR
jgi:hypothetical protein